MSANGKEYVIPASMQPIVERAGYVPAVRSGDFLFCAGQVGRTEELEVINDPQKQFEACWENLRTVLSEANCDFEDVIEMTTYHVQMSKYLRLFIEVKDRMFPRETCAWTCVGVAELAKPGLLAEIKVVAKITESKDRAER